MHRKSIVAFKLGKPIVSTLSVAEGGRGVKDLTSKKDPRKEKGWRVKMSHGKREHSKKAWQGDTDAPRMTKSGTGNFNFSRLWRKQPITSIRRRCEDESGTASQRGGEKRDEDWLQGNFLNNQEGFELIWGMEM